jgi:hypothetical protein
VRIKPLERGALFFTKENIMNENTIYKFGWYVTRSPMRDFFHDYTLGIMDFISKPAYVKDLIIASSALGHHKDFEDDIIRELRIAYDIVIDAYYFIFKVNNNGTTFVISRRYMIELDQEI